MNKEISVTWWLIILVLALIPFTLPIAIVIFMWITSPGASE